MKKIFLITAIFCAFALDAHSKYIGPSENIMVNVKRPRDFMGVSEIVLEGQIERHLEKDWYVFTDDAGSVIVKITPEKLEEFDVSENDTVRIHAEIERSLFRRPRLGAVSVEVIE